MKKIVAIVIVLLSCCSLFAQQPSYARALANTAIKLWPDSFSRSAGQPAEWSYDQGVILKGIEGIWMATGDPKWFDYMQKSMDHYVREDGSIKGYRPGENNIDHLNNGKVLLTLYRVTGQEKYRKAIENLYSQIEKQPRTTEGSFWHKYPYQVWLDGLYMAQPFYAEYAMIYGNEKAFDDITRQFVLIEQHARDPKTGLLYHGWDESREQQWADKKTGLSPHVWARALGWFGMAMVDVLDYFPPSHPGRDSITAILHRFAKAVSTVQDSKTGLWYTIPDMPNAPKNDHEASASAMLAYTLAKGVRYGYLPASYTAVAKKAYNGILQKFIREENGQTNLHGTLAVSGPGGKPYYDGSFAHYMSEPVIVNDPTGMGAFIKMANEIEMLENVKKGKGRTVLLDTYFNNEWRKGPSGKKVRFHYTWDDRTHSGFATLGSIFNQYGFATQSLAAAPTAASLKKADVYLIVDPDTEKETEKPAFMTEASARVIADWVKGGGTLILLANDAGNAELKHFNTLASKFGIRFNEDNYNMVKNDQYEQGAVVVGENNPVFKTARKVFIKELATLEVEPPATTVLRKEGKNVLAVSKHGRGAVLVLGDPWLYNEYVDGRKLPLEYENYKAARDLVEWVASQKKK